MPMLSETGHLSRFLCLQYSFTVLLEKKWTVLYYKYQFDYSKYCLSNDAYQCSDGS